MQYLVSTRNARLRCRGIYVVPYSILGGDDYNYLFPCLAEPASVNDSPRPGTVFSIDFNKIKSINKIYVRI